MNQTSLLKTIAALLLAGGLALATPAPAQTASELQRSLDQGHWFQAHHSYQSTPFQVSIPVLRQMANNNHVMAQWFLADALAHQGQDEEATQWLYTASLGTRMDASLCKMKAATFVEFRFLDTFRPQFDRLRKNDRNRYNALQRAVAFHRSRVAKSASPTWVCSMVAIEAKRPMRNPAFEDRQWEQFRYRALQEYQKQTGLDFSRSPDLFPITPVKRP